MALDLSGVVPIYQENIDALINQLGKTVTLHYKSTVTSVPSALNDDIRDEETRKPDYKVSNPPTTVENTEDILALIKYNPKDFLSFGISISKPNSVIRLKTFLTDVPKLTRCEFITAKDSQNIIFAKYQLLREPYPVGIKENRYAISFWERI